MTDSRAASAAWLRVQWAAYETLPKSTEHGHKIDGHRHLSIGGCASANDEAAGVIRASRCRRVAHENLHMNAMLSNPSITVSGAGRMGHFGNRGRGNGRHAPEDRN
jgi:hypothetical protein